MSRCRTIMSILHYSRHCCSLFSAMQLLCTSWWHCRNFEPKMAPVKDEEKPEKSWMGPDSHRTETSNKKAHAFSDLSTLSYKPDARCANPFLALLMLALVMRMWFIGCKRFVKKRSLALVSETLWAFTDLISSTLILHILCLHPPGASDHYLK